jgi:hypothetical protein
LFSSSYTCWRKLAHLALTSNQSLTRMYQYALHTVIYVHTFISHDSVTIMSFLVSVFFFGFDIAVQTSFLSFNIRLQTFIIVYFYFIISILFIVEHILAYRIIRPCLYSCKPVVKRVFNQWSYTEHTKFPESTSLRS